MCAAEQERHAHSVYGWNRVRWALAALSRGLLAPIRMGPPDMATRCARRVSICKSSRGADLMANFALKLRQYPNLLGSVRAGALLSHHCNDGTSRARRLRAASPRFALFHLQSSGSPIRTSRSGWQHIAWRAPDARWSPTRRGVPVPSRRLRRLLFTLRGFLR